MYHFNDLLVKNGSYFDKRSELPFTGAISGKINLLKSSMPAEVKGYFKNGKLHGRWQWYLIERETHIEGHFSNGLLHGLWESHDKNNNLILHINFNNSEKDGPFRINNENNVKKIVSITKQCTRM